jgi:hypothetical protein
MARKRGHCSVLDTVLSDLRPNSVSRPPKPSRVVGYIRQGTSKVACEGAAVQQFTKLGSRNMLTLGV